MTRTAKSAVPLDGLREYRTRWIIPGHFSAEAAMVLDGYAKLCLAGDAEKVEELLGFDPILAPLVSSHEEQMGAESLRQLAALEMLFRHGQIMRLLACEQFIKDCST